MRHCEVRDVMTADPVTVTPATPLKDVADLMVGQRISSVPVVTPQGRLVGLVTEGDLVRKELLRREHGRHRRVRRAIAAAETAGEIMTTDPPTVRAEAAVAEAARLMDRHQAGCLLVTGDGGKLVGLVTPRDLLRVFLRPDAEIRAAIVADVLAGYLGTNPAMVQVDVTDGVVRLTGEVERKSMLADLLPAIRAIDGVIDAEAQLSYAIDDTRTPHRLAGGDPDTLGSPLIRRRLT